MSGEFGAYRFGSEKFGDSAKTVRTVTGFSTQIDGDVSRQNLIRSVVGYTTQIQADSVRSSLAREVNAYSNTVFGTLQRELALDRFVTGYADTIRGRAISANLISTVTGTTSTIEGNSTRDLSRQIDAFVDTIFSDIERSLFRDQGVYASDFFGSSTRGVDLKRPVTGFTTFQGDTTRTIDVNREITGFSNISVDLERSLFRIPGFGFGDDNFRFGLEKFGENRFGTTENKNPFTSEITGDSIRDKYDGSVIADGFVDTIEGDIDRFLDRVVTGFTNEIDAEAIRFVDLNRSITGFTDPVIGLVGFPEWLIGLTDLETPLEEERTFDTFTFTFIVEKEKLKDSVRPKTQEAGKVDVIPEIQGGFDAVDRSNGDNSIQLIAPLDREDVRTVPDWLLKSYEEEPLDTQARKWEVELELVPENEKRYDNEYGKLGSPPSLSDQSDKWYLQFENGDVLTDKVTTDLARIPNDTFDAIDLTIIPTKEEVKVIEENLGLLNAQYTREVPDGKNVLVDETDGERNTVTISPPDGAETTVENADYVVNSWTTEYNQSVYSITLEVVKK